jgi:hypothetical protein
MNTLETLVRHAFFMRRHAPQQSFRALQSAVVALVLTVGCAKPRPQPRVLECHVQYADTLETVSVEVASSPYTAPSIPIHGRFEFRGVYVTEPGDLAVLNIYVYQTTAERHSLVHQLKLYPPYDATNQRRFGITGLNVVYDERARELQYWCGFAKTKGAQ